MASVRAMIAARGGGYYSFITRVSKKKEEDSSQILQRRGEGKERKEGESSTRLTS